MRVLLTESGARYEVVGDQIRRTEGGDGNTKRRDGEWVRLLVPLPDDSLVGMCAVLSMEPLSAHGPDDRGVEGEDANLATTRFTTPVVADEWIPA